MFLYLFTEESFERDELQVDLGKSVKKFHNFGSQFIIEFEFESGTLQSTWKTILHMTSGMELPL